MGRAELRRRTSMLAALHVLTVQRCLAVFLALLCYGALLWLIYTAWLHDGVVDEDAHRRTTLPVDYETYRTSERYREAASTRHAEEGGVRNYPGARFRTREETEQYGWVGDGDVTAEGDGVSVGSVDSVGYPEGAGGELSLSVVYRDNAEPATENALNENQLEEDSDGVSDLDDDDAADEDDAVATPQNRRQLVVTSVPHTGSELLSLLLRWLSGQNSFSYVQLPTLPPGPLPPPEERRLTEEIARLSASQPEGSCVSHSSYVVDFAKHEVPLPLQFSLIRDPIDRVMSRFVHDRITRGHSPPPGVIDPAGWSLTLEECLRARGAECSFLNGHQYPELAVPVFCGHHHECTRHNSRWALERAKRTVQRRFVTVGVLEDMNTTLAVAETLLPRFFSGVWDRFFIDLVGQIGDSMYLRPREELSAGAREVLKANLTTEYEFYEFVKQRVEQQYSAFVLGS